MRNRQRLKKGNPISGDNNAMKSLTAPWRKVTRTRNNSLSPFRCIWYGDAFYYVVLFLFPQPTECWMVTLSQFHCSPRASEYSTESWSSVPVEWQKQMYTPNSSSYLINRLPIRILNTDQKFQSISQGNSWFGIAPFPRNPFNLSAEIPISSPPCHIPLKCIGISHTNLKHALLTCSFHSTNQPPISQVAELQ